MKSRDYEKEYKWAKEKYKEWRCKLPKEFFEELSDIPRREFLEWCQEKGIMDKYRREKEINNEKKS